MADFHPIKIKGNWASGYALDLHIESSEFVGYDAFGHEQFDNKRTLLGELLYKLKYKSDKTVLDGISHIIRGFIRDFRSFFEDVNMIIPVPPSATSRRFQPVVEIANRLGGLLKIQVLPNAVRKSKDTPPLKDVLIFEERLKILKGVFEIGDMSIKNKTILLLDDLYRSGATLTAITRTLYEKGDVSKVKVLALTKTRRG